jgi:iron complex outermembrane recepter protein
MQKQDRVCWIVVKGCAVALLAHSTQPVFAQELSEWHLEEVVVTAQRRTENQQNVPVAVTASTAEQMAMAQVDSIANIQLISPSIKFDVTNSAANSANILIRGIGTVGNSRAFEGAVGVFVDGAYRTRAGQAMQNWLDIESLQILRGPQGTLFGKNTSAGALILNSTKPDNELTTTSYEFSVDNYHKQLLRSAVNLPVTDALTARLAGLWGQQDGYIKSSNGSDYNDRNPRAVKLQLMYEPSPTLTARLVADWASEANNCCYGQVDFKDGAFQPLIDHLTLARGLTLPSKKFSDYEQVLSNNTEQVIKDAGMVLNVAWELANGLVINSVSSYRDWTITQDAMDADFTGANILTINESLNTKMVSQEITFSGDLAITGPLQAADYVLGVYYSDEDIVANHQLLWGNQAQAYFDVFFDVVDDGVANGSFPAGFADASEGLWSDVVMPAESRSLAAFMHWNLDVSDKFAIAIGMRYSQDQKEGAMYRNSFTPAPTAVFRLLQVQPGPEYSDRFRDNALTGSLALTYHLSEAVMGYLSFSRGYKAGGVNIDNTGAGTRLNNPAEVPGALPNDPTYTSEWVNGYELGVKAEYLNRRARSNVAIFYNDIEDLQIAQFVGTQFTIDNAPEAEVYGAEMENHFLLNPIFSIDVDVTYLAQARFGYAPEVIGSLSNREFAHAPEFAGNIALTMELPLAGELLLQGRLSSSYTSDVYTNTSNDVPRSDQTQFNASLGLAGAETPWSLTAWCQNCGDERFVSQHFNSPLQVDDINAYVVAPRTYGLTLRGSF